MSDSVLDILQQISIFYVWHRCNVSSYIVSIYRSIYTIYIYIYIYFIDFYHSGQVRICNAVLFIMLFGFTVSALHVKDQDCCMSKKQDTFTITKHLQYVSNLVLSYHITCSVERV